MRTSLKIAIGAAIVGAVQLALWLAYRTIESKRTAPGQATFAYESASGLAPGLDVPLELPGGATLRIRDRSDEALLVHFWATWCAPCRTELPTLLALAKEPNERAIRVLLVSVDENWETIGHFFGGKVPAEVVRDGTGELKRASDVATLPETLLLTQGNELRARVRGSRGWTTSSARDTLKLLLSSKELPQHPANLP